MLEDLLKKLELTDYESKILNILYQNSPSGATFIAKKCNLSRSSIYTVLNSLIAKGLVGTTYKNEIKQFTTQGYSGLEQILKTEESKLKEKFHVLEKINDKLKILEDKSLNIPQIIIFEGKEGLKKIYKSMIRQSQKNSNMFIIRDEFIWDDEWKFVFEDEWHDKVKKIKTEKNIFTHLLINPSKIEKSKKEFYNSRIGLKYRTLNKENKIEKFSIYIIDDIVSILSMENQNLIGIKITNKHIANNFIQVFNGIWEKSKK